MTIPYTPNFGRIVALSALIRPNSWVGTWRAPNFGQIVALSAHIRPNLGDALGRDGR